MRAGRCSAARTPRSRGHRVRAAAGSDMAQAGGTEPAKLPEALKSVREWGEAKVWQASTQNAQRTRRTAEMRMRTTAAGCAMLLLASMAFAQAPAIDATTAAGDKVRLLPDGRWEYVDPKKQAEMPKPAPAAAAQPATAPSAPTQGGLFGVGRTIQPGDPDYNRGSLNPRGR